MTPDPDADHLVTYFVEVGHLKQQPRAGWLMPGVRDPESVAEHSYRTGVIAYALALLEGANPDRAATLALFHDTPEARTGDIPSVGKLYMTMAPAEQVAKDQTADLPVAVAHPIQALIAEFEARTTLEAQCAKDADKLECLIQAREYLSRGYLTQSWVDTMVAAVRTPSGRRLAEAAQIAPVDEWWHDIVSSYGRAAR